MNGIYSELFMLHVFEIIYDCLDVMYVCSGSIAHHVKPFHKTKGRFHMRIIEDFLCRISRQSESMTETD